MALAMAFCEIPFGLRYSSRSILSVSATWLATRISATVTRWPCCSPSSPPKHAPRSTGWPSATWAPSACARSWRTLSRSTVALPARATSGSPPSVASPAISPAAVPNTSLGAARSAPFRSRRQRLRRSATWKNTRSTPCSTPRTLPHRRAGAGAPCSCSSTTRGAGRPRRPKLPSGASTGQQRSRAPARHLSGQGRQNAPVPAAAHLGASARAAGPGARSRGGGLPESAATADHPLRHPPVSQALRGESRPAVPVAGHQEGQPASATPHGGNAPAALGSGPQHQPSWLGHVRLDTTTFYAAFDLQRKAKAITLFDSDEPARD